MSKHFSTRGLKSELKIIIQNAMNEKKIETYAQLSEICGMGNVRLSEIWAGTKRINEKDLLKISKALDIPMDCFRRYMKTETKYYIDNYIPVNKSILSTREYQHEYYMKVTKEKRKQKKKIEGSEINENN